ncbi:excinuclease ABC subunit UvrC [uncultured Ilyobacter sp.]|uniref:excinuclease ABC subunit UvrC n=1 Tax=uncultured Ilyobacter sp. TaxID=544433 RepID=UPI0029C0B724|nr:excinuclease ABC subunit UvrC [uncultured Ilyobacter sp.]
MDIKKIDIPENPGVYLMKKGDKVIYVGKAKNLKKRVSSYFNREHIDEKTRELVKNIESLDFIICNSELDALVLENNLIKRYSPKYNISLKDEKTYPYIKFTKEDYPKITIIRTTKSLDTESGYYFGPYPFGCRNLKKTLIKIFKIRDCKRDMSKKYPRPCLKYFMNLCTGPCVYKEVMHDYRENVENAKKLLKGRGKEVIAHQRSKMEKASEELRFEEAILYRNQLKELENAEKSQVAEHDKAVDEDLFVFSIEGERLFLCVLNMRDGKILEKKSSGTDLKGKVFDNLFQEVVTDYYSKHTIPKNIVFQKENEESGEILGEWLTLKSGKKIHFHFPKVKSRRMELLDMALLNLQRDIESYFTRKSVLEAGLMNLYSILELKKIPRRIECFDISNIQGKDAVASMSVAIEGKLTKKEYRKFKIKTKDTPDDFQMMREVAERRYSKLKEHELPDLILIDGGLGQLGSVGNILKKLKKSEFLDIISIAKREEEIFKLGETTPYIFPKSEESLKILQRLRDEAHRFGVTYHRKLRSKRVISSQLDGIEGIGPKRKEALLKKFGSVSAIKKTSEDELCTILSETLAKRLIRELNDNGEKKDTGNR